MASTIVTGRTRGTLNRRAALLVALAVFAQESVWNFYDSQVPASIAQYTTSAALIGLLMGLDNVLGIVLQPLVGHLSDRTRTRWGRRVPFLVVGAPIAAVFFVLIPATGSFGALVTCVVLFALTMNTFKPVTESLIPDAQPADRRSTANAVAKVATSLTIVVASLISLLVVDDDLQLAFAIPAGLMVLGVVVVALTIKETTLPGYRSAVARSEDPAEPRWSFGAVIRDLGGPGDRSRLALLAAVLATAGTWAAVRSQLTPYAMHVFDVTRGQAGSLALPAGLAFIAVAVPIALVSERVGRLRVTRIGLVVFIAGCVLAFALPAVATTMTGIVIASIGYAAFAVNGVVILWNLAPSTAVVGMYTGLYGVANAVGSSLGPGAVGALVDLTDWSFLLLHTALLACAALVLMLLVRREMNPRQFAATGTEPAEHRAGRVKRETA